MLFVTMLLIRCCSSSCSSVVSMLLNIGPARCYRQLQNVPIDDLWSQLCLVAKDSIEESCYGEKVIHYCAEFGKSSDLNNLSFFQEWSDDIGRICCYSFYIDIDGGLQ